MSASPRSPVLGAIDPRAVSSMSAAQFAAAMGLATRMHQLSATRMQAAQLAAKEPVK